MENWNRSEIIALVGLGVAFIAAVAAVAVIPKSKVRYALIVLLIASVAIPVAVVSWNQSPVTKYPAWAGQGTAFNLQDNAARERAEQEASRQSARDAAERDARQSALREASERERQAREAAEREAHERAALEATLRETQERHAREAEQRDAREREAREAAEREERLRAARESAERERRIREAAAAVRRNNNTGELVLVIDVYGQSNSVTIIEASGGGSTGRYSVSRQGEAVTFYLAEGKTARVNFYGQLNRVFLSRSVNGRVGFSDAGQLNQVFIR